MPGFFTRLGIHLGLVDPFLWEQSTMERFDNYDWIMTVPHKLGGTPRVVGDCTVWHTYPSGHRCRMSVEIKLCNAWTRLKWEHKGRT